jgi:glycosyltransferase involved in cell wall biosynthesis
MPSRSETGKSAANQLDGMKLRVCFYAPFKPLDHPDPSGDQGIASDLYRFLERQGHDLEIASRLRSRWIFWKPWQLYRVCLERRRLMRHVSEGRFDLWLTYHTYYKGPDVIGPAVCQKSDIPYVIFQGIYSTKRRKKLKTRVGFALNRKALLAARHVFTNKKLDLVNLKRLLPEDRISYIPPGIFPEEFAFDPSAREELRRLWQVSDEPVLLSAAMFRADVKTRSLAWTIRACGELHRQGRHFRLVIAGDGPERATLEALARRQLPGKVHFSGKMPREKMRLFYSAGDIFVFPGIGESLGMVFLEAQACGLPVVAFDNLGVPEVVEDRTTGWLCPVEQLQPYVAAIDRLLTNRELRTRMGNAARRYVRERHDLNTNYRQVEKVFRQVAAERPCRP